MPLLIADDGELLVTIRVIDRALIPQADVPALAVTEVFQTPFGADHRVVSPVIGREVALLV